MSQEERSALERELVALKEVKEKVVGSACEVYSRCCGYLRPIANWNAGKQSEFEMRKFYAV